MYRFGQNDANTSTYTAATSSSSGLTNGGATLNSSSANNNLNTRTAIKRSVSQVPTTERRPILSTAQTQSPTVNNNNNSNSNYSNEQSNSLDSKVNKTPCDCISLKIFII